MAPEPPSPSSSSVLLPFLGNRSRRGSLASIASKRELDRDAIAQALDHIHISASKSDALTSFHDFDGSSKGVGSAKELVSNGMNNLYSRFRTSVSGPSPQKEGQFAHAKQTQLADHSSLASSDSIPSDKHTSHSRASTSTFRSNTANGTEQRPAEIKQKDTAIRPSMVHVGVSHLPGFQPSAVTSPMIDESYSFMTQSPQRATRAIAQPQQWMQRSRTGSKHQSGSSGIPTHLKRRVISKEFWMKDENAKVCFDCGQSFSTFRRKHHCRTCGQIFDSKCTSIISAHPFGQPGQVRLCKPCEQIVLAGKNDDSSVYSDDGEELPKSPEQGKSGARPEEFPTTVDEVVSRQQVLSTPTIGIPASRRNREAKRRSAVIEFDADLLSQDRHHQDRLLHLVAGLDLLVTNDILHRARFARSSKSGDSSGPFLTSNEANPSSNNTLPVFHNDNIIDPDLARILHHWNEIAKDSAHFWNASNNKSRRTRADRGQSISKRDDDAVSMISRRMSRSSRHGTSVGSVAGFKPSPRRSRSNRFLKAVLNMTITALLSALQSNTTLKELQRSSEVQLCNLVKFVDLSSIKQALSMLENCFVRFSQTPRLKTLLHGRKLCSCSHAVHRRRRS
ncbi:hypothetical protein MRB53_040635 [Persea americana]|nr:hypothetical protein MRB53_040635 [Persea americana]